MAAEIRTFPCLTRQFRLSLIHDDETNQGDRLGRRARKAGPP